MSLLSALDDFLQRTLARVPGVLAKLYYFSSLRDDGGSYRHWGMIRSYGEGAAGQAMTEAHQMVLLRLLRTPLNGVVRDAEESAAAYNQSVAEFVRALSSQQGGLLPAQIGGGSARHFNSVLQVLACLAPAGTGSNRPAS